mmetsp:Transcript_49374/g.145823  ORF Transcript_49374/g.145823 Transcript_49374/m.145823 type:complete len:352 (+) Transcript_49374:551-1606(+)
MGRSSACLRPRGALASTLLRLGRRDPLAACPSAGLVAGSLHGEHHGMESNQGAVRERATPVLEHGKLPHDIHEDLGRAEEPHDEGAGGAVAVHQPAQQDGHGRPAHAHLGVVGRQPRRRLRRRLGPRTRTQGLLLEELTAARCEGDGEGLQEGFPGLVAKLRDLRRLSSVFAGTGGCKGPDEPRSEARADAQGRELLASHRAVRSRIGQHAEGQTRARLRGHSPQGCSAAAWPTAARLVPDVRTVAGAGVGEGQQSHERRAKRRRLRGILRRVQQQGCPLTVPLRQPVQQPEISLHHRSADASEAHEGLTAACGELGQRHACGTCLGIKRTAGDARLGELEQRPEAQAPRG